MGERGRGRGGWNAPEKVSLDPNRQWAALRRRYEWDPSFDNGVAPRDEELEKELFGEEHHVNTGINFFQYEHIKVTVKNATVEAVNTFEEADLHPVMKENVRLAQYSVPTPVQKWSIPIITQKYDLMACAQTGSGKTAAFLVPILTNLFGIGRQEAAPRNNQGRRKAEPLVLILAPTRELATQIFDECRRFTYRSFMRPCVVYGGADPASQRNEMYKGCDVLTATPGRLSDFLDRGVISLRRVKYVVLDEADRMLNMGFESEMRRIIHSADLPENNERQTLMFSATFPKSIRALARDFLKSNYVFLSVGRVGGTTKDITQKVMYVEEKEKRNSLVELLLKQPPSRTLIFVETKRGADSLDDFLYSQSFPTTSIHGDRTQREREDALIAFKNGRSPILIATQVAARGLDIKNVMHVINYDLCNEIDEYIHRIGRTARVGNPGLATTFYNEKNQEVAPELVKILKECGQEIPDFLREFLPNDSDLTFDDDLDENDTQSKNPPRSYDNRGGYQNNTWENQPQRPINTGWDAQPQQQSSSGGWNNQPAQQTDGGHDNRQQSASSWGNTAASWNNQTKPSGNQSAGYTPTAPQPQVSTWEQTPSSTQGEAGWNVNAQPFQSTNPSAGSGYQNSSQQYGPSSTGDNTWNGSSPAQQYGSSPAQAQNSYRPQPSYQQSTSTYHQQSTTQPQYSGSQYSQPVQSQGYDQQSGYSSPPPQSYPSNNNSQRSYGPSQSNYDYTSPPPPQQPSPSQQPSSQQPSSQQPSSQQPSSQQRTSPSQQNYGRSGPYVNSSNGYGQGDQYNSNSYDSQANGNDHSRSRSPRFPRNSGKSPRKGRNHEERGNQPSVDSWDAPTAQAGNSGDGSWDPNNIPWK